MIATPRLYLLLALAAIPFALSGIWPVMATVGAALDVIILVLFLIDVRLTQSPSLVSATRTVTDRLSIGRENEVTINVTNTGALSLNVRLKDDYPQYL